MNNFLILSSKRKKLLYCLSGAIVFYFPLFSAYSLDCRERFSNRKREFIEFELAVEYIHILNFQSRREYRAWSKSRNRPSDIPSNPDRVYKDQWRGWGYYLGTDVISNSKKEFRNFELAVEYIRALNFRRAKEHDQWSQSGNRPSDIPSRPDRVYKKQWRGWGHYLGTGVIANRKKEFREFELAVKYIRALNFQEAKEHEEWSQSGNRPADIPAYPGQVYKNQWRGWDYYLGESFVDNRKKEFRDFELAVEYIHTLNFQSRREYGKWSKSGNRPADIPSNPNKVYKNQWRGWEHYLGTGAIAGRKKEFRDFELAVEYIHALKFQSHGEYDQWSRAGNRPSDIPSNPGQVYKNQWQGWGHYLGTGVIANRKKEFRDFELAVEYIHTLNLRNIREYNHWSKSGKRPDDIPSQPDRTYKKRKQWRGWGHYLGTGVIANRKKEFREFELAVEYIHALNFRGVKEHGEWSKSGKRPVDIPSRPDRVYKKQWRGWGHYLGTAGFD